MEKSLRFGDRKVIADALCIPQNTVAIILRGQRGTRKTNLQKKVKAAAELRERQNRELEQFCEKLHIDMPVPTPHKKSV